MTKTVRVVDMRGVGIRPVTLAHVLEEADRQGLRPDQITITAPTWMDAEASTQQPLQWDDLDLVRYPGGAELRVLPDEPDGEPTVEDLEDDMLDAARQIRIVMDRLEQLDLDDITDEDEDKLTALKESIDHAVDDLRELANGLEA